jgi:uncharacterized membrane protein YccC
MVLRANLGDVMPDFSPPPRRDAMACRALADRLAEARSRLAELDLPLPLAARLHRQFIAVCDAVKAAGADEVFGERRLAAFLATLEKAAAKFPGCAKQDDNS